MHNRAVAGELSPEATTAGLGVDLAIPDRMSDFLGTRNRKARQAGRSTSESKASAARKHGATGARPRKEAKS